MNKKCLVSFNTHNSISIFSLHRCENKGIARKRRKAIWPRLVVSPPMVLIVAPSVLGSVSLLPADNLMKLYLCPAQHLAPPGTSATSHSTPEWCPYQRATTLSHQCLLSHSILPTPSTLSSWFFFLGELHAGHISMRDLWIDTLLWCLSPAAYIHQRKATSFCQKPLGGTWPSVVWSFLSLSLQFPQARFSFQCLEYWFILKKHYQRCLFCSIS